jgi:UDP-GlcNAc:undecaprenyl-phosphate GlcNAc-1-phosphate transferase
MLISTLLFGASVLACCSFADRLGQVLGVIDHPDGVRKHHARPTPLVGGIALMVPLLWVAVSEAFRMPGRDDLFLALGAGSLGFMILGLYDDRRHVQPAARLLVSTVLCASLLMIEPNLRLETINLGFGAWPLGMLAVPFTVLCLVGLQNAINMADGMNGLVIGMSIFWTLCLLLYAPSHLFPYLSFLLFGLFILLPYNLMGYLFLGDSGSYALGVGTGLLMIYVHNDASAGLPTLTVVLWLLIPVLDCLRVMLARVSAASSPLNGDRNHLHHRLSRHWPWPVSVMIYLALATLPGLAAAIWPSITETIMGLSVLGYTSVIWFTRSRERLPAPA